MTTHTPLPTTAQTDRIVGCLLGLAVGDALGAPIVGWTAAEVQERLGGVHDYPDLWRTPGLYTSRAQQALCLLDVLLEDGQFDPLSLAARFVQMSKMLHQKWPIYGAFRGTSRGFREAVDLLARGTPWDQAGMLSAANDPAVRVAPLALWSRERRLVQFREDVARSAWLTHRDPRAVMGALVMGYALIHLVNLPSPARFQPSQFLREVVAFAKSNEGWVGKHYTLPEANLPPDAVKDVTTVLGRYEGWLTLSTTALLEQITRFSRPLGDRNVRATSPFTVASLTTALLLFARQPGLGDAVQTAVNLGGDTAGIGALVGALGGALHGVKSIPSAWLAGLQNRDFIQGRAEALAQGAGLPPDAPKLTRVEAALTEAEIPRIKAKHAGMTEDEGPKTKDE